MSSPRLQRQSHQQARPESSVETADDAETAGEIEAFRVRIADHVQAARSLRARDFSAMFHQAFAHAPALGGGLDEQRIELRVAVRARRDRRKTHDGTILLQYEHAPGPDLLHRHLDGVRMPQQGLTVAFIAERGTKLQRLKGVALGGSGGSDGHTANYTCAASTGAWCFFRQGIRVRAQPKNRVDSASCVLQRNME